MKLRRALVLAMLGVALGGCRRCGSTGHADAGSVRKNETVRVESPPLASLPDLRPLDTPHGYGLPSGCTLEGAITRAELPEGRTRFVAARSSLDTLAFASATSAGGTRVERAGFLDFAKKSVEPAPWAELDSPPLFERAASGWLGAFSIALEPGLDRVVLFRSAAESEAVAEGDHLGVADLACSGDDCALLTTLARAAAVPGGTLFFGKAGAPSASWREVDLDPGAPGAFHPLSILALDAEGTGWVSLAAEHEVRFFRLEKGAASPGPRVATTHAAYDTVLARDPLVIAPGAAPDQACDKAEFPLLVLGPNDKRGELRTPAAPESVVARRLGAGAIVAWVAPVSCQFAERRVVYAALLHADGSPASSAMAVADASGFALATQGDELGFWLESGRTLARIRAKCQL